MIFETHNFVPYRQQEEKIIFLATFELQQLVLIVSTLLAKRIQFETCFGY